MAEEPQAEHKTAETLKAEPAAVATTTYVSFSADISQQSTEALLAVCANLAQQKKEHVYMLFSTPGGSVMHGLTLYNVLRGMPFKLTTHNVGNVNSIGNVVFLAGEERYSCPNSTFMFHGVGFDVTSTIRFEEKLLRERLDSVVEDQKRIGAVIRERSTLDAKAVEELFLQAMTRDPDYAKQNGIIHDIREVKIPLGAPIVQLVFKR
jgi:ATP-dependent Clp protease protease subunit